MAQHDVQVLPGVLILTLAALPVACGSPPPEPKAAPAAGSEHKMVNPLADDDDIGDGLKVEGVLGNLEQNAIQAGLDRVLPAVAACFQAKARRQPYLGGEMQLQYRVARDGTIKKMTVLRSSLGALEVERCVVDAAKKAAFAKPRGGEAEFTYPLTFQGRVAPEIWEAGAVADEIEENREKLTIITEGRKSTALVVPQGLVVTFYVNGRGKAVSVGMIADEEIDEEFAGHFVAELKKIKFVEPGSQYAKVTITW